MQNDPNQNQGGVSANGYCHCGCGGKAPISPYTDNARGYVKGEARRFIHGHHGRKAQDSNWDKYQRNRRGKSGAWQRHQQLAIDMRVEGATLAQIGEALGCSVSTAARLCGTSLSVRARHIRERKRRRSRAFPDRATYVSRPSFVALDKPGEFGGAWEQAIADPRLVGQDPYVILTAATDQHMDELLGDLTIEDVGRMDERTLAQYRERILAAGLAPSSVQRKERERLQIVVPHRGQAPAAPRGKKSSRQRGGKERSARHQTTGKRFNRRKDERRERQAARDRKAA